MTTKTVAIIGAGPGGLVAAKTLLQTGSFEVTVFEKNSRIGGIWSVIRDQDNDDGFLPPNMPTNLSRFAVTFADLDWLSVEMPEKEPIHMHPKAWQVNQYLEEYARRHIPQEVLRLYTEVTAVKKSENGGWDISSKKGASLRGPEHFDYCIVASGFYTKPPSFLIDGADSCSVKMVHSSEYRGLSDIVPDGPSRGKKLLVVGGANSGGEAAAALAFDLSNRQHSPGGTEHGYEIIHVISQPVYGLPLFVPSADMPGSFVPLDVRLYDYAKRKDVPLSFKAAPHTEQSKKFVHGFLQEMLGSDKYELGSHVPPSEVPSDKILANPKAAIQDNWASFVRSGAIKIQQGRVTSLKNHGPNSPISATIASSEDLYDQSTIDDIAGVIYAIGYNPSSILKFLDSSIITPLEYSRGYNRLPLVLLEDSFASTPDIPDMGFIGYYEGPYWGVMEMQARGLAKRWTTPPGPHNPQADLNKSGLSNITQPSLSDLSLRRLNEFMIVRDALFRTPTFVPQYIFGDYMAIMEEATRDLGLTRYTPTFGSGSITPAYYLAAGDDQHEADKTRADFQQTILAAHNEGRFVLHAIFRGILGGWHLSRTLSSSHPDLPSGSVDGEMWFHPRAPGVIPDAKSPADREYLCLETGKWTTENGHTMPVHKATAWRFSEEPESISVWFLQPDSRSLDRLYHDLKLVVPEDPADRLRGGKVIWKARAEHWCDPDTYVTEYRFVFNGVAVEEFNVVHTVTGPKKDYVSATRCTRLTEQDGKSGGKRLD